MLSFQPCCLQLELQCRREVLSTCQSDISWYSTVVPLAPSESQRHSNQLPVASILKLFSDLHYLSVHIYHVPMDFQECGSGYLPMAFCIVFKQNEVIFSHYVTCLSRFYIYTTSDFAICTIFTFNIYTTLDSSIYTIFAVSIFSIFTFSIFTTSLLSILIL